MMLSGSSSYYDEYVRKKGTGRVINDPPSLLTDRGAYVNFLEVQLERVSAACLGVQAYDQRFNDMQQLIVTLEQRCGSTTRLVGLAQQCTEELRSETERRIGIMQHDIKEEYKNVQVIHQATSQRIAAVEQGVASLTELVGKLDHLEDRVKRQEEYFEQKLAAVDVENRNLSARLEAMLATQAKQANTIETLQTSASKLEFVVSENDKRVYNAIGVTEKRLMDTAARDADEMQRRLHGISCKLTSDIEEITKENSTREVELHAAIRRVKESASKDFDTYRKDMSDNGDKLFVRVNEHVSGEIRAVKLSIMSKLGAMETMIEQSEESGRNAVQAVEAINTNTTKRFEVLEKDHKILAEAVGKYEEKIDKAARYMDSAILRIDNISNQIEDIKRGQEQWRRPQPPKTFVESASDVNTTQQQPTNIVPNPASRQHPDSMPQKPISAQHEFPYRYDSYPHSVGSWPPLGPYIPRTVPSNDAESFSPGRTVGLKYEKKTVPIRRSFSEIDGHVLQQSTSELRDQIDQRDGHNDARFRTEEQQVSRANNQAPNDDIRDIFAQFLDVYKKDQDNLQKRIADLRNDPESNRTTHELAPNSLYRSERRHKKDSEPSSSSQPVDSEDIELLESSYASIGSRESTAQSHQSSGSSSTASRIASAVMRDASEAASLSLDDSPIGQGWRYREGMPVGNAQKTRMSEPAFGRRYDLFPAWQPTKSTQPRQWPSTIPEQRLPLRRPNEVSPTRSRHPQTWTESNAEGCIDVSSRRRVSPIATRVFPESQVLYGELESDRSSTTSSSSSSSTSTSSRGSNVSSSFVSSEIFVNAVPQQASQLTGAGAILK